MSTELRRELDRLLIPFVTREWLDVAPNALLANFAEAAQTLGPEETLGEAFPDVWSSFPESATAGLAFIAPQPAAPSPASTQPAAQSPVLSQLSGLSPLILPAVSRSPSLGSSAPSPASAVAPSQPSAGPSGLSVESLPRRGRSSARAANRQPSASVSIIPPSPVQASSSAGPSSVPPRTSKKRPADDVEMEARPDKAQWKNCKRCCKRKSKCAPPKGATAPFTYPCATCLRDGEECLSPSAPGTSFSSFEALTA
jgi:hypothetical protein